MFHIFFKKCKAFIVILSIVFRINKFIQKQKRFLNKSFLFDLNDFEQINLIDKEDIQKIYNYYGLAVPGILGEFFCILRGSPLKEKERAAFTYFGSITGIFDDFFDKYQYSDELILSFISHPTEGIFKNPIDKLFYSLYKKFKGISLNFNRVERCNLNVFDAQVLSRNQTKKNLTNDELNEISFQKGSTSLLSYWAVINEPETPETEKLIGNLGALLQFENDIFDVYKDSKNNIHTLITDTIDINIVKQEYLSLFYTFKNSLHKSTYTTTNKTKFYRFLLAVIVRGFVCLDFLFEAQLSTNNKFILSNYSRKQLVCDMETPRNLLKTFKYYMAFLK